MTAAVNTSPVLFLDLATTMGWCEGVVGSGDRPISGTVRLAPVGSSPAAIYGGLLQWLATRLPVMRYRMICYEAPMDPRHMKTNINTARVLLGLPAIVEAVAHQTGHYRVTEANVNDVRKYLLGRRPAKGDGKRAVMDALRPLGYAPADDNEADAIAGWLYVGQLIEKRLEAAPTAIFAAGGGGAG